MILSYEPVLRQESKLSLPVNVSSKPPLNMLIRIYKCIAHIPLDIYIYMWITSVSEEIQYILCSVIMNSMQGKCLNSVKTLTDHFSSVHFSLPL